VKKVLGSRHQIGRESLLGPAVEVELVQYILKVEERGFGLTPTDVRELVFCPVIELSGGWEGSTPQFIFQPPSLFLKITLGVRLNPPEQRSTAQCILLSACINRFPARVSFKMTRSSEATTVLWIIYLFTSVDVAHADVLFLYIYAINTAMYMRLYCRSREIESLNAAECYTGWHKINWTSS